MMTFNKTSELMWNKFVLEFGGIHNNRFYFKNSCDPRFNYAIEYFHDLMWIRVVSQEENSKYDYVASEHVNNLFLL
ncbi:MAG: hypothetical protein COA79_07725 [Planctomycetota bacterium]|nr:MAG: hypothetical protein COA79_07725 [Planctomycetota bacterium]